MGTEPGQGAGEAPARLCLHQAHLTRDLTHLLVLSGPEAPGGAGAVGGGPGARGGGLVATVCSTGVLQEQRLALQQLSVLSAMLAEALDSES